MNLLHPPRLDALARDYAAGLMQGGARRRFERLLQGSRAAQVAVGQWEERLGTLAAAVPPMAPRPAVWQALERQLQPATRPASRWSAWWSTWRSTWGSGRVLGGALGGAVAGILMATALVQQQPGWLGLEAAQPGLPASYVGLLTDAAGQPTLLASSRRHGRTLSVKLLRPLAVPAGRRATLWALPQDGGPAFRVGAVPSQGSAALTLPAPAEQLFFRVSRLTVTYEADPAGSAPAPETVLSGHCVKLW